jgi:hypothetical protein
MDSLEILVKRFDHDPDAYRAAIQTSFESDRESFVRNALPLLRADASSPGYQYLLAFLIARGCAVAIVSDAALLTADEARTVARRLSALDPLFAMKLARAVPAAPADATEGRLDAVTGRLVDLIVSLRDGQGILPAAAVLLRHPDRHIQSKAALIVGRIHHSHKWVDQKLSDPDPRVRANAVESLWGANTEGARAVFLTATANEDNRVAGNAVIGLYRMGDATSIGWTASMSAAENPRRRATGAWIMGRTGDARFAHSLRQMVADADPDVRRNAYRAMCALNGAHKNRSGDNNLLVVALLQTIPGAPSAKLRVEDSTGMPVHGIRPTMFSLTAGGVPVFHYEVQERGAWYEVCWEPPSPEHAGPVEIFVQTPSASGSLVLHRSSPE